ncbi:MAG TPA: hypothetical protein VNT57_03355 [Desulfobacteria bacterium]|nr:hypothetical protein [Desulfobacteria bacterium]
MELYSFWVINPADGQDGRPEPVKLVFFENGDMQVISLSEDPDYQGAYRLPSGSYSYSGETLTVQEENLSKLVPLTRSANESEYKSELFSAGLINDREWDLFYGNPRAWKALRIVAITFGDNE